MERKTVLDWGPYHRCQGLGWAHEFIEHHLMYAIHSGHRRLRLIERIPSDPRIPLLCAGPCESTKDDKGAGGEPSSYWLFPLKRTADLS